MVRKRSILFAVFTVFIALFMLHLSAFTVSAREEVKPGLILGFPDWENDRPNFSYDLDMFGTEAVFRASYTDCIMLGWVEADGNIHPISLENADKFMLIPEGEEAEEFSLQPQGEWEYDPETDRDTFVPTGDGLFELCFMRTGKYTLLYQGPEPNGAAGDFCAIEIEVELPPVGLYKENSISNENLLATRDVFYRKGSEFYLLGHSETGADFKAVPSNISCSVRGDADVDITPINNGFKITIQDARESWIGIQVFFDITYSHKDGKTGKWVVDNSHEEDRWLDFRPEPRRGLAVGWPEDGDDGPVFSTEEWRLRGWIDRRASYMDWTEVAWIDESGNVTPISTDNLNDFTFSAADGSECDFRIEPVGDWIYDEEKRMDVLVPAGDGFFNIGFAKPGTYTMTYSGPEAQGADADACSVTFEVTLPWVGLYKKNEVSAENLLWMNDVEYRAGSEYYILPHNENSYGQKTEVSDIELDLMGREDAKIDKIGSGYKLTVSENTGDWFNVRMLFTKMNSHYDEEAEEWIPDGSDEEDRWINFKPMEKYGLVIGHIEWQQIGDSHEHRPVFTAEDMGSHAEADVYDVPGFALGWKSADGQISPIPLTSIDKFKAYDAQGKEIHDWIWPHRYWVSELRDEQDSGDGLFAVRFDSLGSFRIEYEGEAVPADVENMTNSVTVNVFMPQVAVYSAKEATFENLISPDFDTRSIMYTNTERVFYINAVDITAEKAHKSTPRLMVDRIEVNGAFDEGSEEWRNKISFEAVGDQTIKVTILPGCDDWLDINVPYMCTGYHWDFETEDWVMDDEWENNTWFTFDRKDVTDISNASISGISLSYGYSGKAYAPAFKVIVDGVTLTEGTDYTYAFKNNKNPGTATLTITGKGKYTGTRIKKFEIVDCVSALVSGKTYQLIPKNNSKTAVCSFSGRMVNNTKVYITDRSASEAMKFVALKQKDGTWKFINAKCEMSLAVQQNSSEVGKGLVLYNQTTKPAQTWKLSKKSDNSFAIINAVSGLSIAMSDASAVKGTTLSMDVTASSGLQRFYVAETDPVSHPYSGTYAVKAAKNKAFALNIASSSKTDGANVNLYTYSGTNAQKFQLLYSGGGYYRLANVNSGLVLTVKGNVSTDGANVIQSAWAAQNGQRWKVTKNTDGSVTLTNVFGTVLHLNGNKTANSTNVQSRKASTSTAQRWYLEK